MRFKCFTLPILAAALMLGGCSVDEDSLRRPMPEPTQMRGPGKVSPDYLIIKLKMRFQTLCRWLRSCLN